MIANLSGKIIRKDEKSFIIDVNGIGYLVSAPLELISKSNVGDSCTLYIRTIVREDAILLYGFDTLEKQIFFDLLMTVTRVGPKLAMDIINATMARAKQAIARKDIAVLASIPGVGRKTAERIILELHEKITATAGTAGNEMYEDTDSTKNTDIIEALQKLGYQRSHISRVLRTLPAEIKKEEAIIKYFLQNA